MPKYPKVNYIGNKEKLVEWIISELPHQHGTVLDLFSGGCSVSYALKQKGFSVISNDILYANYVLAKALVENSSVTLPESVFDIRISDSVLKKFIEKLSFLSNRLYFEEEIPELARLVAISQTLKGYEKYLFLSLLRRAMIRKLPYSRMNIVWEQIVRLRDEEYSYARYKRKRAYHNQSFESHMRENLKDYNQAVFDNSTCTAVQKDACRLIKELEYVDMVYIDPPYPSTMNNYDAFYGLFDEMFDKKKEHQDLTRKESFTSSLEALIIGLCGKTKYVILSQNTRAKPTASEIEAMLSKYGRVTVKERNHNYQVTGKDNKKTSKELLFILEFNN